MRRKREPPGGTDPRDTVRMRKFSMLDLVTVLSALGCGLIAGAFFAFSTFVMKTLGNLPPTQGIAARQSINVVVINPWFLMALRLRA
jgi:uncharacterized membrane protein